MRREWHIWEKILLPDNCRAAVRRESQTHRCKQNGFSADLRENEEKWAKYVRERLGDGLKLGPFIEFDTIECGKLRHVRCYTSKDAMCVRAAVQVMEPRAYARMTPRSYCPVAGRGGLKLAQDMRRSIGRLANVCRIHTKYHPKATPWTPKIGTWDFVKYYDSLAHDLMSEAMERIFGEPEVLNLCAEFLGGRDGLPIGAGYSSMIANMVLAPLDWEVQSIKGVAGYARHLDNAAFITKSKAAAREVRETVEDWAALHGLKTHEWAIFPVGHHAIESGGWRIDGERIIPSEPVTKHLLRLFSKGVGNLTEREALALASLYGFVKHGESQDLRIAWRDGGFKAIFKRISVSAKEAETGRIILKPSKERTKK